MKHSPKYSFSFRLKWEATKSNSSRDNSLGWKVEMKTEELSWDHLYVKLEVTCQKPDKILQKEENKSACTIHEAFHWKTDKLNRQEQFDLK